MNNTITPRQLIDISQKGDLSARNLLIDMPGAFVDRPGKLAALIQKFEPQNGISFSIDFDEIASISKDFHRKAGTIDSVIDTINLIASDAPKLRIAHTPDMFAYLGVYTQFIFLDIVSRQLSTTTGKPVCTLMFLVDHESIQDKRLRASNLPDVDRDHGSLKIKYPLNESLYYKSNFSVEQPTKEIIDQWVTELDRYIGFNLSVLRKNNAQPKHVGTIFRDRLEFIRSELIESSERAENLAEFNAIFLSRIINNYWKIPVAIIPVTKTAKYFSKCYEYLITIYPQLVETSLKAIHNLRGNGVDIKENLILKSNSFPLWFICPKCNTRVQLWIMSNSQLKLEGRCIGCSNDYRFDLGSYSKPNLNPLLENIAPKVLFDELTDILGWQVRGGTSYIGSAEHIIVNSMIAKESGLKVPPEAIWRPRGAMFGFAELRYLKQSNINVENNRVALAMNRSVLGRGSILYYLISQNIFDLKNTWTNHFLQGKTVYDLAMSEDMIYSISKDEIEKIQKLILKWDPRYS